MPHPQATTELEPLSNEGLEEIIGAATDDDNPYPSTRVNGNLWALRVYDLGNLGLTIINYFMPPPVNEPPADTSAP